MSMSALSWHDDRSPRELARWAIAGAIVLGVHAGALIYLLAVHEPDVVGSNMDVVTVELAPIDSTAARASYSAAGQGRCAESGIILADESDATIAALQALPGFSAIAQRRGRCAVKL